MSTEVDTAAKRGRGRPRTSIEEKRATGSWRAAAEEKGRRKTREPLAWSRELPGRESLIPPGEAIRLIPDYDPFRDAGDCRFHSARALRAVRWFHAHATHVKGALAGKAFVLSPLQQGIVANLYGWLRPNGTRRYREAFVYVPRKWGKTLMAAGLALYALFEDGEGGAEVYCAAAARDQAKLLWNAAKFMVLNDRDLTARCRVYQHSIARYGPDGEQDGAFFQAISSEATTAHGFNPHLFVMDELHAQRDRDLFDVLDTGTAARTQPLAVSITTADYFRESICNERYEYAKKVRDGILPNPHFLPVVFEADVDSDWRDPEVWAAANPNYPTTPTREYMEARCRQAEATPAFLNTFLRLNLNIRTNADVAAFDMRQWDECPEGVDESALVGATCWGGLDLSKTVDLTAFALWFPGQARALLWFWIPRATALEAEDRDRVPYTTWARQGWLELTEGDVVDYEHVRDRVLQICEPYDVQDVAFDPWNGEQMAQELHGEGLDLVKFIQGPKSYNEACKELLRLVVARKLGHGGNPVLRWCASNLMWRIDANENYAPDKQKSTGRIDGVTALAMAIGRAIVTERPVRSVYERRGVLTI